MEKGDGPPCLGLQIEQLQWQDGSEGCTTAAFTASLHFLALEVSPPALHHVVERLQQQQLPAAAE